MSKIHDVVTLVQDLEYDGRNFKAGQKGYIIQDGVNLVEDSLIEVQWDLGNINNMTGTWWVPSKYLTLGEVDESEVKSFKLKAVINKIKERELLFYMNQKSKGLEYEF